MDRRVDAGRAVRESFRIYADDAAALITFAAAAFLPVSFVAALFEGSSVVAASVISLLLSGPATLLYHGAVAPTVVADRDGRPKPHPGDVLDAVQPIAGMLAVAGLLWIVAVMLGLLAFIIPGLILVTVWAVVGPVIALERREVIQAFTRSRELVSGEGWRVFAAIFGLVLLLVVATILLQALGAAVAGTAGAFIGGWVGTVVTAPPGAILATVLFLDLGGSTEPLEKEERERREEEDEEDDQANEAGREEAASADKDTDSEEGARSDRDDENGDQEGEAPDGERSRG
ncbi:MAG TPA: hypothetical protein VKA89_03880 [Solirubrobacterales bacterium]|nr:hypothetical protein [Solirubrobacterales bacterium]